MTSTADETRVLSAVRTDLYLGGVWTPPRPAARSRSRTRPPARSSPRWPTAAPDEGLEALRIAAEHQAALGGDGTARARRDPAPRVRADDRAGRRPRAADDARDGQAARRVPGRGHVRRRVPALVQRGGRAGRRPLRARPGRATAGSSCSGSRSGRACSSPRGTSRSRWAPARSGPAVAAGCTMVVKPAKQTPLSMLALAGILDRGRPARGRAVGADHVERRRAHGPACSRTRGCARSPSPGRPRWAASWSRTPRTSCCARRWSSVATRRSWSSRTPTWTRRSTAR